MANTVSELSWSDRLAIALACIASILALILFWIDKTALTAGATISSVIVLMIYPILHFLPSRRDRRIAFPSVLIVIALFGWSIWPQSEKANLISRMADILRDWLPQIRQPWFRYLSSAVAGAIFIEAFRLSIRAFHERRARLIRTRAGEKGFMDYKLQTELAINAMPAALKPITEITQEVGRVIEHQARQTKLVATSRTEVQIRVVKATAGKLERLTQKLRKRCNKLESVGINLQEGMIGWFQWIKTSSNAQSRILELVPSLKNMCASIENTVEQTNIYIGILQSAKGVSREMNAALDHHIQVITRIRDASANIHQSCESALALIGQ